MMKKGEKEEAFRVLVAGVPDFNRCNNKISTAKYSVASFIPVAVLEQFRRVGNMYFLIIGTIMAIGVYTDLYESAISPWTTLGPLAFVIAVSLFQEGLADMTRHRSDSQTNNHPCVVLAKAEQIDKEEGKERDKTVMGGNDVTVSLEKTYMLNSQESTNGSNSLPLSAKIAFQSIKRMDIRQGHIVLVRNRDMVPADLVLLASSSDNGNAYIETSSIDGETNLKLRTSPHLPKEVVKVIKSQSERNISQDETEDVAIVRETLPDATRRICRLSALAFPDGISALDNPANPVEMHDTDEEQETDQQEERTVGLNLLGKLMSAAKAMKESADDDKNPMSNNSRHNRPMSSSEVKYVTALKSEPPNASVNTFGGVLLFPPIALGGPSVEIPLNADNILLRGAVLRNTEWAIGISCFTGSDTKLVQNSFETPSKFSQLDKLMNQTVIMIVVIMAVSIAYLSTYAVYTNNALFEKLWYVGLSSDVDRKWPYLQDLDAPEWETSTSNWFQLFFLYVTLLNNLVPLSLYITVEVITAGLRVFINLDLDMYDPKTDTRTVARSTTVTDLGQVQYVFSDKTGTLTQNVMVFKRCSVDGLVFGPPVLKNQDSSHAFHPLKKLLIGKIGMPNGDDRAGLEGLGGESTFGEPSQKSNKLTFNAEMFFRVMSLCHTVVVEKDYDANKGVIDAVKSTRSNGNSEKSNTWPGFLGFAKKEASLDDPATEDNDPKEPEEGPAETATPIDPTRKGKDGAPSGFAYQAESPDEGALVQASSLKFDFQVIGRDSSGIRLSCSLPSLFEDSSIVDGLKDGSLTAKDLAAKTASVQGSESLEYDPVRSLKLPKPRTEVWQVLAVNKFDSTRKRMSVLVRSPESLGAIPMLLCKGADTAMLDPKILDSSTFLMSGVEDARAIAMKSLDSFAEDEGEDWERSAILGLQSHMGEFAKEGLRTLVLGIRILSEQETTDWLAEYKSASTSIKGRDEKLTTAAENIEKKLHIVGATAIEDKLQDGVPGTISMLGKAGIKLWVLTGDKRETAKEIGYATKVLTEKMRPGMVEVAAGSEFEVRTKMAMEFLKLVKYAKLPEYQKASIGGDEDAKFFETMLFKLRKLNRRINRIFREFYHRYIKIVFLYFFFVIPTTDPELEKIQKEKAEEEGLIMVTERRRGVRNRAEEIVNDYLNSDVGQANRSPRKRRVDGVAFSNRDLQMHGDAQPDVFSRAQSARMVLDERRNQGSIIGSDVRNLTLANVTAHDIDKGLIVDEDILSMRSHLPSDGEDGKADYDKMKRTLLERLFAVDKAVRHGRLVKHMTKEKLASIIEVAQPPTKEELQVDTGLPPGLEGPRALVIEGHALERLLGDAQLEELLFAVANTCDSVIACRVSPAQKAQLVQLVRRYVVPEPVTLAIGDGANDVGMIQEAHVGVGISGKEGQQAVNASDFAIAQFKFLQELVLIHGRWNFMRQSEVVLFSFYKNALMAGLLITYTGRTLYSGTPLFDQWVIAMLNFVAGMPITALGFFDRSLDKKYIKRHPEVYGPTRRNELFTKRTVMRWVALAFVHIFTLYYFTVPVIVGGGGISTAWVGLMYNESIERPGDGEGGDLKSVGLLCFTCLILLLSYKVIFQHRSIIVGKWPSFTCREDKGEGFVNRTAYTWIANAYFSIAFYLFGIYVYQIVGRPGASEFSPFVETTWHVFHTRTTTWMLFIFVPIAGMVFDVSAKVFSNLFYPSQTQIHSEIFAKGREDMPQIPETTPLFPESV